MTRRGSSRITATSAIDTAAGLVADPVEIDRILAQGADRAHAIADPSWLGNTPCGSALTLGIGVLVATFPHVVMSAYLTGAAFVLGRRAIVNPDSE